MTRIKNINKAEVMALKEQVEYQDGQVVSKTLAQNEHVSVTLFSFDKGEEIGTHESGGDAFVTCLDGVGKVTIDGEEYILKEGASMTEAEMRTYITDHMARHKVPKYIDFVKEFPMNVAGKILKYQMREDAIKKLGLQKAATIETA